MTYNDILNIKNLRKREKELRTHYNESLRIPHCDTGRKSIITEDEFKKYVEIFVEYDLKFKLFPKNHPSFPGIPMARTIRDYFDYSAKVHGFTIFLQ